MLTADGYVIGIEVGVRGRRVAVADLEGKVVSQRQATTPPPDPDATIAEIDGLFRACLEEAGLRPEKLVRAGCGFSGPVDATSGVVLSSPRLDGWEGIPLGNLLEERLGLPTLVDNDARVAALGEARYGAGRGEQQLAYVHLGTGLGGGLVLDGRLYRGATATAGEIGHILVNEDGPLCSCGKPGHLEAYASGTAIVQRALELAQQRAAGPLLGRLSDGIPPTPALVFEAARSGSKRSGPASATRPPMTMTPGFVVVTRLASAIAK
jgi:glucokinase